MITSSLIIFLATTAFSWIAKLITMKMQGAKELREAELRAMNAKAEIVKEAREYRNKGFEFTRRFIAITAVIFIVVLPIFAPFFYSYLYPIDVLQSGAYPHVWFGYEVVKSGFWPFTDSTTTTVWKQFAGIVITPWHTQMISAIMGLYFGSGLGNHRK